MCSSSEDYCESCLEAARNYNRFPEKDIQNINNSKLPKGFVWIYFVKLDGFDYIKIGKSSQLKARLSSLAIGFPVKLILLCKFIALNHVERMLHQMFDEDRVRGEWFNGTDQIKSFMELINSGEIPDYLNHPGINGNEVIYTKRRIKIINRYNKT